MSILEVACDSAVNITTHSFHMKPKHKEEVMFQVFVGFSFQSIEFCTEQSTLQDVREVSFWSF